jgi:RsmE family RNA methyltransferase
MNLVLFDERDCVTPGRVILEGRRARHLEEVLGCRPGDELRVGRLRGGLGFGRVVTMVPGRVVLEVEISQSPPLPLPVSLLLALPRPKVLRRTLAAAITLGVKEIYLFHACRVEKSYWESSFLKPEKLFELSLLALEQAGDTIPPEIYLRKRFRPFAEDEIPGLADGCQGWFLHPAGAGDRGFMPVTPALVVIGPEGGFVPFELELLAAAGLRPLGLGSRILRVEQVVPAILGRFL